MAVELHLRSHSRCPLPDAGSCLPCEHRRLRRLGAVPEPDRSRQELDPVGTWPPSARAAPAATRTTTDYAALAAGAMSATLAASLAMRQLDSRRRRESKTAAPPPCADA